MTETAFEGGCHCGRVRFRVRVPDDRLEALDCDCSICTKKGFLHLIVTKDAFELLSGGDAVTTYTFNTRVANQTFSGTGYGWPSLPPCASVKRAGSEKRLGVPCTTSATIASESSVRAPTPGVARTSAKSTGPRSFAAASAAWRRGSATSRRVTWW